MSNGVVIRTDWSRGSFWLVGKVDCFRAPRHPSRVDAKRGGHFLQADFTGLIPVPKPDSCRANKLYFCSFNDNLRGKNKEHCDKYPDDVADRQRQTSDR